MIVLVCGGRDYHYKHRLAYELSKLERDMCRPFLGLIHGAAEGADRLAAEWQAGRIQREYRECAANRKAGRNPRNPEMWCAGYPADWERHGKAAGPIRNQHMLDQNPGIELVIAFPGGKGTADMVARARKKGIPVVEIGGADAKKAGLVHTGG